MKSFDEWLIEYRKDKKRSQPDWYPNQVDIYEAGKQSKQVEIDALRKQIVNAIKTVDDYHYLAEQLNEILKGGIE